MEQIKNLTPLVWLQNLPQTFCSKYQTQDELVKTFVGVACLLVVFLVAKFALSAVLFVYEFCNYYIVRQTLYSGLSSFKAKYQGEWVVVSGGSEGIGLSFAKKFAQHNFKLILLARNQQKLDRAADELRALGSPHVVTISVDFDNQDKRERDRVRKELDLGSRKVGVLINNVGMIGKFRPFHDVDFDEHQSLVNVNCLAAVSLTSMIVPQMRQQNFGTIVNISSLMEFATVPNNGLYGPSKSFLSKFSRSLHCEYSKFLTVVNFNTSFTKTKLYHNSGAVLTGPCKLIETTTDNYANSAFNIITAASSSWCCGGCFVQTSGHIMHQIFTCITKIGETLGIASFVFCLITDMNNYSKAKTEAAKQSSKVGVV